MKYNTDMTVNFAGKQYKIVKAYKTSFVGQPAYDIEALLPDDTGLFPVYQRVLESMLKK